MNKIVKSALAIVVTLIISSMLVTQPVLAQTIDATGWVWRFNVSDLTTAKTWYEDNLQVQELYTGGDFAELCYKDNSGNCTSNVSIGLSQSTKVLGSNQATATIKVSNIDDAVDVLDSNMTNHTALCYADGTGELNIVLSFFCDDYHNSLAYRDDDYTGTSVVEMKCPSPKCPLP